MDLQYMRFCTLLDVFVIRIGKCEINFIAFERKAIIILSIRRCSINYAPTAAAAAL